MRACVQNAEELLDECDLLMKHGRYARAVALGLVALEEMGKLPMLAGSPRYGSDAEKWRKRFWRRFRNHREKILLEDMLFPVASMQPDYDAASSGNMLAPWGKYALLREAALYADFETGEFIAPSSRDPMAELAPGLLVELRRVLTYHWAVVKHMTPQRLEAAIALTVESMRRERAGLTEEERAEVADITLGELLKSARELGRLLQGMWDAIARKKGKDAAG
jgi:AbiV family abortive infection protein